ncbi:MAG: serine/threonine protein kinase [Phycisphaeraceae bacterium]|nr:serine/threonine protein kinase [Phycisphaeraceae bacterium]
MERYEKLAGYEIFATLGTGARSTIYAVTDDKGQVYALKQVTAREPRDLRFLEQAISEHDVCRRFDHPALRKSFRLIKKRKLLRLYEVLVVMEMIDGQTLEKYQCDSLVDFCHICESIAAGLGTMHAGGFIHADIKPSNVVVAPGGEIKIIDFGQSCPSGTIKPRIQGTPDYIAPEQVLRQPIRPMTDVFNLGATMYWLLTGKPIPTLIPRGEPGTMKLDQTDCRPPAEINAKVPPALSTLVMQCIETEPSRRPSTMKQVADRLALARHQLERNSAGNAGGKSATGS